MHQPTKMVFDHRSCQKATHNTRQGPRHWNHWYNVYRCPVCGRLAAPGRRHARSRSNVCRGE